MSKKKKVVTTGDQKPRSSGKKRSTYKSRRQEPDQKFLFSKQNYILMAAGFVLILIGLLLMSGGAMPSPEVWDEDIIYSFRRVTLAPIVILAGLGVEIYAIFKK